MPAFVVPGEGLVRVPLVRDRVVEFLVVLVVTIKRHFMHIYDYV